jgi:hypothetical protein
MAKTQIQTSEFSGSTRATLIVAATVTTNRSQNKAAFLCAGEGVTMDHICRFIGL